ncbi:hypothetical protein TIFTF001_037405 [Ficus carica]|uniref:Integrase catalytic domain-containing protein n=1 Tax=Ficus carica TaxID=3494 RepID=A0AA88E646_FICCA|nr:hypothetical protein TIFTF001_037405 [Ficus carica]
MTGKAIPKTTSVGPWMLQHAEDRNLRLVRAQSNFEDASVQSLAGNTTVKSSERYISTLETNQHELVVSDETEKPKDLEFPNSFLPRECALHDGVMLQENNIQFVKPKGTNACESEMKRPSTSCLIPVSVQDCGSDTAKQMECQNQEDIEPVSVDSKPAIENYNLDAQFQHDVGLHDHYTTLELGSIDEDHRIDAVSAEDVQVEGDPFNNHIVEHDDSEDKQINLSVESSCRDSSSQPEDKFSPELHNSLMGQIFALNGENDVSKHQEDQDKQKSKDGNIADLNLEVSVHDRRQFKSPGLPLHEHMDQVLKEYEVVNCMIGEPDGNSVNQIKEVFPPIVTGVGLSLADNSAEVFNEENDFENVLELSREPLRCLDTTEAQKVLREVRVEECGEHQRRKKLYQHLLRMGYYWPTMGKDPPAFVKKYFTKWVKAIPLRKATGAIVSNFFRENLVCRFDIPYKIVIDNGTPFINNDIASTLYGYRIKQRKSMPYYPQGNGQAEANNKTLIRIWSTNMLGAELYISLMRFGHTGLQLGRQPNFLFILLSMVQKRSLRWNSKYLQLGWQWSMIWSGMWSLVGNEID